MDQDSTLFILSFQKSVFVKRSNVHCLQFYIGPTLLTTASMRGIEIQKEISGFFNIGLDIGKNTVGVLKYMIGYSRVYFLLLGSSGYYWVFPGIS